jgi:hypothetical protein
MAEGKYPDLARRLAAATLSYISGVKSIDHFMEEHIPEEVSDQWHVLAEGLMDSMKGVHDGDESKLIH